MVTEVSLILPGEPVVVAGRGATALSRILSPEISYLQFQRGEDLVQRIAELHFLYGHRIFTVDVQVVIGVDEGEAALSFELREDPFQRLVSADDGDVVFLIREIGPPGGWCWPAGPSAAAGALARTAVVEGAGTHDRSHRYE